MTDPTHPEKFCGSDLDDQRLSNELEPLTHYCTIDLISPESRNAICVNVVQNCALIDFHTVNCYHCLMIPWTLDTGSPYN